MSKKEKKPKGDAPSTDDMTTRLCELRARAELEGDDELLELCERALKGDPEAFDICVDELDAKTPPAGSGKPSDKPPSSGAAES